MRKFPLRGFIWQAPQALYTVTKELTGTGYGLVLGSIEGFKADVFWGTLRGYGGAKVRVQGPPPSDLLGKAHRYLLQPAFQYWRGGRLSYEDHWLLAAADAVAIRVVQESGPVGDLSDRWAVAQNLPLIDFVPWHPATRAVLAQGGVDPDGPQRGPIDELGSNATYGEALAGILAGWPQFVEEASMDFPASTAATALELVIDESGRDVIDWLNDGDAGITPVFDPEEMILARMFEYGIFPPAAVSADQLDWFFQRAGEIAAAGGRDLPGRGEMISAAEEVFGGFVSV